MRLPLLVAAAVLLAATVVSALPSDCESCHAKITPMIVKDFNRGAMSETMTCAACHGEAHHAMDDAHLATLPTMATCAECHEDQVHQYSDGKHALGRVAMNAMPGIHGQPDAFVEGQKGCGGCHTLGLTDQEARASEDRQYYRYGMDCQNCHTRHAFSKAEAKQPEACQTCHMGFDHPQWEMWSSSKHGVTYLMNRAMGSGDEDRAPTCQDCHMVDGDHRVMTPWGFLGVRLPEDDAEWMGYRASILKGLGVLDADGQPTGRLDVVVAGKVARLDAGEFAAERKKLTDVCERCHSANFTAENFKNADLMLKEADQLMAEAIEIVAGLMQEGLLGDGSRKYPDLLMFYDVDTHIEQILYEMFMDHRMKAFQGGYHMNPDYSTWYGYAKMRKDLAEIREIAAEMRAEG
ncbi:MAG TPA: multiheme c-type cytochrome, partial [Candidatus Krumholzibacteria bacterium]|nr:multiheme c-type cytochrome [Candidatus Krumholzibacteria bacterium]